MKDVCPSDRLAQDVEEALLTFTGADFFPSDQWPELARSFANVVWASGEVHGPDEGERLLECLAQFTKAVGKLVDGRRW